MICPRCGAKKIIVKDSRKSGNEVLRRRQCLACKKHIYTVERIDDTGYAIQKLSEIHIREACKSNEKRLRENTRGSEKP